MKKFLCYCLLLINISLFAQQLKPIAVQVEKYHKANQEFVPYTIFTKNEKLTKNNTYSHKATDAIVLNIDKTNLTQLNYEQPQTLSFTFPYEDGSLTVELYRKDILTEGFSAIDQNKKELYYNHGVYYRGIVKNKPNSIVAFSFFKDNVYGLASIPGVGNIVLGKLKGKEQYISYNDFTLTKENTFHCGVDEMFENQHVNSSVSTDTQGRTTLTSNCVRIYYEIAYQPYLNNGESTTNTVDWITAVHNNISTLYANDDIQVALSEVMVWTTPDPYTGDFEENLGLFSIERTAFNGDLAHLVNAPATTSVAYLNSLCSGQHYAYSGIDQFYADVPTYSWTINAMTHEMGHSMGSPHTHACAWNGNNTAIDGCGAIAGYDEGCDGPLPEDGGTIMSYCHLVEGVGVNLSLGFGPQPGALIRNTVDSKDCLGTDCINSCTTNITAINFTNITQTSATVTIVDEISTGWDYILFPYDSDPNWNFLSTSSNSFQVSNLEPNTYYVMLARNQCDFGGSGNFIFNLLLTNGDYCGGDKFVDTGGENGNYDDMESLTKTFYPTDGATALTLNFESFALEDGYDFMTIYDGETTDAPIFEGGNLLTGTTVPGPFTSTNESGAITVKYVSDTYENEAGWIATLSCANFAISTDTLEDLNVYPNPVTDLVNVQGKEHIETVRLYDITGKLVLTKYINSTEGTLQLSQLSKGMYFMNITSEQASKTIKIIKN